MSGKDEEAADLVNRNGEGATTKMLSSQDYEPTEEDKAYKGWKHLIPFRPASKNPKTLPLISAGPVSYATAHWANGLMYQAYKRDLTEKDIYDTPWKDSASCNSVRFEEVWNEELAEHGKKNASVARAIIKMVRVRMIVAIFLTFAFSVFAILGPLVPLRLLTESLEMEESEKPSKLYFIGLAVLLALCHFAGRCLCAESFVQVMATAGVRVRGGVLSLVFKKILFKQNMQNKSVGELVNLCANDGQRLYDATMMGVFSLGSLASLGGAAYGIYLLGAWGVLGFVVFFLFIPIQIFLSKIVFKVRSKAIPITEERVKLMSEIVTAIKLVKMYAWEKSFAKKIHDIRVRERSALAKSLMIQSISSGIPQLVPLFASAFTFLAMTRTNNELSVTQAFVFISLLNALRFTLGVMPYSMKALAEGRHACDRVKAVLISEEDKVENSPIEDAQNLVEIRKGCFGWLPQADESKKNKKSSKSDSPSKKGSAKNGAAVNGTGKATSVQQEAELQPLSDENDKSKTVVTLRDITMSLKEGTLLGVCGAVGSGKTSIIQAILGMMVKEDGEIAINPTKNIAYVPQQAWIMNTTVKENIIFGQEFDQERYDQVIEACALLSDFDQLPAGDQTEIGERGINLSGGQKQRISIARAVYGDSDLILLDDPLSAVDAHVGQHIFANCLKGFLKDKTILFVTHQLQFLTGCDNVLVMKDGRIAEEGTHETLMRDDNGEYSNLIKSFHDAETEEKKSVADSFFSRQQSKLSAVSRQYSEQSNRTVQSGDKSAAHENDIRLRLNSRGQHITDDAKVQKSHSIDNLHVDGGTDFRGRAVSMSSMKSARSQAMKAMAEARSNNRLNNPMEESMLSGSMVDIPNYIDDVTEVSELNANNNDNEDAVQSGKLTKAEKVEQGSVKMSTYASYMRAAGGPCIVFLVFAVIVLVVSNHSFANYWLSIWIKDGSGGTMVNKTVTVNGTEVLNEVISDSILLNPRIDFYQAIYGCSLITCCIFLVIKSQSYVRTSLRASSRLHDKIFRKLVASPMRFFDVTPSGQILNRFSKDMDEVDAMLPFVAEQFINNACVMIITLIIIATVFYYFLLAMLPILILFFLLFNICQKGIRSAKRIDNVTRSPLYSHIATTVQGLATIRAYKKERQFHTQFDILQDKNNMALFLFHTAMRWTAVRLDTLSLLVVFATSLFVTFMPADKVDPSLAALALAYAMNMTGLFQYTMRLAIETEARFTSVERIQSYIEDLESEAPPIVEGQRPGSEWPKEGAIKFDNVDVRYREGLPLVLKSISIDIKPQEKIGIVGRTGSGKSSLAMVLFRMMELDGGSISIDNIDVSTIGLEDLRSKLSIIPQDPVLFVGTVRYNLDPFHTYTDDELWEALTKCHVKHTIKALDGQLDATIVENGENFSVGERQLLCMARALLRHSKILLLDEATAAIDTETDSLIQDTIKEAFADCTMLTIAHRLNTVSTSDRILVLDEGKVIEFDTPAKLLADKESVFAQMMAVQESQKHAAMETGTSS